MESPSCPGLPTVVHHLAQQVLVREVFALGHVAGSFDDLASEPVDLGCGELPEIAVQRVPGFQLLAVDQQGARTSQPDALLVVVLEEVQPPVVKLRKAVVMLLFEAGDVVINQLGCGRVIADDDEAGRNLDAGVLPEFVRPFVVTVERVERVG